MTRTAQVTRIAPVGILIPKSICKATAPPRISAREVEILARTALTMIGRPSHFGVYFTAASLRQSPVTIPRCATLCCNTISIMVDKVTTQSKAYPYSEPAARLLAQLPGSIKPTVTNNPGPIYLNISNPPKTCGCFLFLSSLMIFMETNLHNLQEICKSMFQVFDPAQKEKELLYPLSHHRQI